MRFLRGKRIVLGVTGGIAAYKAAELTRVLKKAGAEVRVVMTAAAREFVGPLTFQALSGNPVQTRLLDEAAGAAHDRADGQTADGMNHIELSRWAERVIIAPASADFIARVAVGMADDLLAAVCLTTDAPRYFAPAMNSKMWANRQTRLNVEHLRQMGARILGPAEGEQACGEVGPGRMQEPETIAVALSESFAGDKLAGLNVMITAGPTREALDVARYISNRSSGKMGFALAGAAREAGAAVTLVTGPVGLATPTGVRRIDVESARQMGRAVLSGLGGQDILVSAAAVADYAPVATHAGKIKKSAAKLQLELAPGIDILQEVGQLAKRPFTVGFAAETEDLGNNAIAKMRRKNMDMIAVNDVGRPDRGFESDDNALQVYWHEGEQTLDLASKDKIARQLVDIISRQYRRSRA